MKLDLDALKQISRGMQKAYQADGYYTDQLDEGLHVYSIQFEPSTGRVAAHIQWPLFRSLVANEADHPASITKHSVDDGQSWLHCSCTSHGVEINTCLEKREVVDMLLDVIPDPADVCEEDDIIILFIMWQNLAGWDLDWPEEVVVDGIN